MCTPSFGLGGGDGRNKNKNSKRGVHSIFEANSKFSDDNGYYYDNDFAYNNQRDGAIWETDRFIGSVQQLRSIDNNFVQSPELHLILGLCHSALMTGFSIPHIVHEATNQLQAASHSFLHNISLDDSVNSFQSSLPA